MKKPPAGMDMFAEMDWKKKAKAARDEWEAARTGGEADAGNEAAPAPPGTSSPAPAPAPARTAAVDKAPARAAGPPTVSENPPRPKTTAPAAAPTAVPKAFHPPAPVLEAAPPAQTQVRSQARPQAQAAVVGTATPRLATAATPGSSLGGEPVAIEQLKQELIAAFKAEIQTAKADILAEIKHMLDAR